MNIFHLKSNLPVDDSSKMSDRFEPMEEKWMFDFKINNYIKPKEISDLRQAVGWNRLDDELSSPLLNDDFKISCYEGNQLIGFLSVVSNGVTDAYIQDVMVHPNYQNQGIGTKLMNMAIGEIKKKGIYMASVIYGEEKLRRYYEKFGFFTMRCGQMELHHHQ